ncbi:MAG: hypothetical protein ABI348_05900 [Nitrososphaera sp.]|jgi:hypothetical protein
MKRPRKISGWKGFFSNNCSPPAWISRCQRCGELLATDKPSVIASHERWCSRAYEQTPPAGGQASNTTIAVLAIAGIAAGMVLSVFALT